MTVPMLFANNASSRLYAAIDAVTTSIRVEAGDGGKFPTPAAGEYFTVTVEDRRTSQVEIMKCTSKSGDILNVQRHQEGTAAQAFLLGATVSNRLTAATMDFLAHAGATGPQGPQGIQGPVGPQGPIGQTGATGAASTVPGPQGPAGQTGAKGDKGDKGDQGIQGFDGAAGSQGPQGVQGPKGDKGDIGPVGSEGPIGPVGATGPQGSQGVKGDQGIQGVVGPQGPKGDIGGQVMFIGDGPPASPVVGQTWFESDTGNSFIWFNDGNSIQWVPTHVGALPDADVVPVGEAPLDGKQYARKDADWAEVVGGSGGGTEGPPGPAGPQGPQGPAGADGSPDTAAQLLAKLVTVDGTGSNLDADLLDGQDSAYYLSRANHTGTQAESTITNLTTDLAARVLKAGDTMTGNLTISRPSSSPTITLNKASAGVVNQIFASTIGVARWNMLLGGGIGENFQIQNFNDAGSQLGTPLSIDRLTGVTTFAAAVNVSGAVTVPNDFTASGTAILSGTNGVYLRPNGAASGTGAVSIDTAGEVTVAHDPTVSLGVATKQYVDNKPAADVTKAYVDSADALKVAKAGDTMTGVLGLTAGTQALPSVHFSDVASGFYRKAANSISVSCNNFEVMNWSGAGNTSFYNTMRGPNGTAGAPTYTFTSVTTAGMYATASLLGLAFGGVAKLTLAAAATVSANPITLPANPTNALEAAPKQYIDGKLAGKITVASTAPSSPAVNDVWIDTT